MNNMKDLRIAVATAIKDEFDGFLVKNKHSNETNGVDILNKADVNFTDDWWDEYQRADGTAPETDSEQRQEIIVAARLLHEDGHIQLTYPYDNDEYVYVRVEVPDTDTDNYNRKPPRL